MNYYSFYHDKVVSSLQYFSSMSNHAHYWTSSCAVCDECVFISTWGLECRRTEISSLRSTKGFYIAIQSFNPIWPAKSDQLMSTSTMHTDPPHGRIMCKIQLCVIASVMGLWTSYHNGMNGWNSTATRLPLIRFWISNVTLKWLKKVK